MNLVAGKLALVRRGSSSLRRVVAGLGFALLTGALLVPPVRAQLPAAVADALTSSKYVYMASTRKDGSFGKAAEIWFLYHQGAVYVGTVPTSWRVRRIKAGRPQAKIWVGKPDGPAFLARGEVVKDKAVEQLMLDTYARKYPDGWPKYERKFRDGFKDGSRVLVRYVPAGN